MDRSPGFGSTSSNSSPLSDSVSLRLPYSVKLATERKSLTHYTKGTQSLCCQSSHCLYACGFRFYFTPLAGVLFAFPSRYWFAIGRSRVFSLGGWSPIFRQDFTCPALLVGALRPPDHFSRTGLSPTMAGLSRAVPLSNQVTRTGCSHFARHYFGNLG